MFCPECGTKNPDEAVFCQECGIKLPESDVIQPIVEPVQPAELQNQAVPVKIKRKMSGFTKVIIGELVLLCILVVGFYKIGEKMYSPEQTAENHFLKVMNGDWSGVYDDFDIKSSAFLSKEKFIDSRKTDSAQDYNTYSVKTVKKDSLSASVDIAYQLKESSESEEYLVTLSKGDHKNFLFFPSLKVDPSDFIYNDYTVSVPTGVTAVLDGVQLDSEYLDSQESGYDIYMIPEIFMGDYDLKLTEDNMEDVDTTISTDDGGYIFEQMTLKEEVQQQLVQQAAKDLESIYNAAFNGSSFDDIADLFTEDSNDREYLKSQYDSLSSSLSDESDITLKGIDFSSIKGTAENQYDGETTYAEVTLSYDYNVTYEATDWWTDDKTEGNYEDSDSDTYQFVYEDGNWLLQSILF